MKDLDVKDKKLFYLLTENSRLKTSEIAKRVGLSKNVVKYRIQRMVERGFIRRFHPITDYHMLGIYSYDLFLKLRSVNERVLKYFSEHPNVIWSASMFGKWDIYAQIAAKNVEDFERVFERITIFLGKSLEIYEVVSPLKRIKINRNIFDYEKETAYKYKPPVPDYSRVVRLDNLDRKILRYLNEKDGLAPYNEIAKGVGSSLETVRNRIRAFSKNGVIVRFAPYIGYDKLGFQMYLVFLNFRYLTKETKENIYKYIRHKTEIKIAFDTLGNQQIYFLAAVRDPYELNALIKDVENRFRDVVLATDHILIAQELKLDFFPKALMDL